MAKQGMGSWLLAKENKSFYFKAPIGRYGGELQYLKYLYYDSTNKTYSCFNLKVKGRKYKTLPSPTPRKLSRTTIIHLFSPSQITLITRREFDNTFQLLNKQHGTIN